MGWGKTILVSLALMGLAGADPEKMRLVMLPTHLRGDFQPAPVEAFQLQLSQQLKTTAPTIELVQASVADLQEAGGDITQVPSAEVVKKLCEKFDCPSATRVVLRFRARLTPTGEAETDPIQVSVGLAGEVAIFDGSTGNATVTEPIAANFSDIVKSGDMAVLDKAEIPLARRCVDDLAHSGVALLTTKMSKARVENWKPLITRDSVRPRFLRMQLVLKDYVEAAKRGDGLSALQHQLNATDLWRSLSATEKAQLEKPYPGLGAWMADNLKGQRHPYQPK